MHALSEQIEEGELPTTCPDCGFTWDVVAWYDAIVNNGDVQAIMNQWANHPINARRQGAGGQERDATAVLTAELHARPVESPEDDGTLPLSRVMTQNGVAIDESIDRIGAAGVANWFITVGFGIAENHGLAASGDPNEMFRETGE